MNKSTFKRLFAVILVLSMMVGFVPQNVHAEDSGHSNSYMDNVGIDQTAEYDGYSVKFLITDAWSDGYNVQVTLSNTGFTVIDNWAISLAMYGNIVNIWNAEVITTQKNNDGTFKYSIKNIGHNRDIDVNGQVMFGFAVQVIDGCQTSFIPESIHMLQSPVVISSNDYSVISNIYGDTSNSFNGSIIIRNSSDSLIEDWTLSFGTDIDIVDLYNAVILVKQDGYYVVKNKSYNSEIKPGEQIVLGFTAVGTLNNTITGEIYNTVLTDIRVSDNGSLTPTEVITLIPTELPTAIPTIVPTLEPTSTLIPTPTETIIVSPGPTDIVIPTDVPSVLTPLPTTIVTEEPTIVPSSMVEPTTEITPSIITEVEPTPYIPQYPDGITEEMLWSDEDGDFLPYAYEYQIGTDPLNPDTDDDGINDYIEIANGLDPLVPDDTFTGDNDSDNDGLCDWQELYVYGTEPLNYDTDSDGLSDGFEVANGFDPLNPDTDGDNIWDGDESFEQTVVCETTSLGYKYSELVQSVGQSMELFGEETVIPENIGAIKKVSVTTSVSGDIKDSFSFRNMFGEHVILTYSPGMVGIPFDISTDSDFDTAVLSFEYDESLLGDTDEADLRIAWYNEEEGIYDIFEDSIIDFENNVIYYYTDHFSKYVLIDKKDFDEEWLRTYYEIAGTTHERRGRNGLLISVDIGCDFFKENRSDVSESLKRFISAKSSKDQIGVQVVRENYVFDDDYHSVYVPHNTNKVSRIIDFGLKSISERREIKLYIDEMEKKASYCGLVGELNAIDKFFDDNHSDNPKKAVIWITSTSLSKDVESDVPYYIDSYKNKKIRIEQIYIGNSDNSYLSEAEENIASTGGKLYDSNKVNLEGICNLMGNSLRGYDVVILVNSGSYQLKDKLGVVKNFIYKFLDFDSIGKIGLIEAYDVDNDEVHDSYGHVSEGWSNLTDDYPSSDLSYRIEFAMDNYFSYEGTSECDADMACEYAANYMKKCYKDESCYESIIMVSPHIITESMFGRYFNDANASGIRIFYIYVGSKITDPKKIDVMNSLFRGTGGDAFYLDDDMFDIEKTSIGSGIKPSRAEKFDLAISVVIARCLGLTDYKDSDSDGLTDVRELNGMILPNATTVRTNPYISDCDNDRLSDGYELGVGRKIYTFDMEKYMENEIIEFSIKEGNQREIFAVYRGLKSNPIKEDSDDDGYPDNGWDNLGKKGVDSNSLFNNVEIFSIDNPDNYVPIINSKTGVKYLGGDQSWFSHAGMQNFGCGVTAGENLMLYLALQKNENINKLLKNFFSDIENGIINTNEYVNFGELLFDIGYPLDEHFLLNLLIDLSIDTDLKFNYFFPVTLLGVQPLTIQNGLNKYFNDFNIQLRANYYTVKNVKNDGVKYLMYMKSIIESLMDNLPIIMEIGVTNSLIYFYEMNACDPLNSAFDKTKNELYQMEKRVNRDPVYTHYMTITKLIIDNNDKDNIQKWIEVETWGEMRYIKYDDWIKYDIGALMYGGIIKVKEIK